MARLSRDLQETLATIRVNARDGDCEAPLADLAQQRGVTRYRLRLHLASLEALGYLTIQRRPGRTSVHQLTAKAEGRWARWWAWMGRLWVPRAPDPLSSRPCQSLDIAEPLVTVGREEILEEMRQNVVRQRHTLLVGPLGIGKSHLLRQFSASADGILYLERISPLKPALLNLARLIHQEGLLEVEGIEAEYMAWEDVRKKLYPLRVHELAGLVMGCLRGQGCILVLDHLEALTPTMLPHLEAFMGVALVLGATDGPSGRASSRGLKAKAQRLWWSFERIEVPPLSKEEARQLLWQVAERGNIENPQLFETRVLQQAGGNPLAIITLAGKARAGTLSTHDIRGLQHGAGARYVSLTPILLVVGALIVAARFVALGLNDRDLYVLAGLGYASFYFLRYFIYRLD